MNALAAWVDYMRRNRRAHLSYLDDPFAASRITAVATLKSDRSRRLITPAEYRDELRRIEVWA